MKPHARTGTLLTVLSVAVGFLTVCVPTVGAASAYPSAQPLAYGTSAWAYGAVRSVDWSGTSGLLSANGPFSYQVSETVGFAVILHESVGAGGTVTLQANRTMGVLLSVTYCKPSCSHPLVEASVTFHAWETVRALLGLTTAGTVEAGGTPVPALALNSSALQVAVGVHEAVKVVDLGVVTRSHNLTVGLLANSSTNFTPALGLVPLSPYAGETWNSTSGFVGNGSASWRVVDTVLGNVTLVNKTGTASLDQSGNLTVNGSYGGTTVRLGGATFEAVSLKVQGPFALREGFLLLPTGADLFGGTPPAWLTTLVSPNGSANVTESRFDISGPLNSGSHLGFGASEVVWSSATANPASAVLEPSQGGALPATASPAVLPAATSNSTSVQGAPEPLSQATADQNCLATGAGCPTSVSPRGLFGELLGVGVAAGAAVLLIAVFAERRRMPPPSYPNAALYPPAGRSATAPSGGRRPGEPNPPAEDDPLGNLW